jgi:hypothetical protein
MKRLLTAVVAAGALVALSAAPAGAQETLGFEIDIDEGFPGDVVNGQVDTADVAEHCNTDPEELQAKFPATMHALLGDVFLGGDDPGLLDVYFPGQNIRDPFSPVTVENFEQITFLTMFLVAEQISNDIELAEEAFPQTFVMTFADIATQQPVGEMGNFDPATGEGSVVVPDIDPGFWGVAAACVSPSADQGFLQDAISATAPLVEEAWLETHDPELHPPFEVGSLIELAFGIAPVARELGEDLVRAMVEPDALGAQIFCIFDETGECPEPPPPPVDDEVDDEEPPPAEPVVVQPVFTG